MSMVFRARLNRFGQTRKHAKGMSVRTSACSRGFLGPRGLRSRGPSKSYFARRPPGRVSVGAGFGDNNRGDTDRFDLYEMAEFLRDRILGDFRRPTTSNVKGQTRTSSVSAVAPGQVDADRKGVISSDVKKSLAYTVTDLDTRDAMEACAGVEGELEKAECFVTFGVGPDADMWYSVVHRFKELLKYDTEPLEESVHAGQER